MLHRIALMAIAAPRRILAVAALIMVAAAIFGSTLEPGLLERSTLESSTARTHQASGILEPWHLQRRGADS